MEDFFRLNISPTLNVLDQESQPVANYNLLPFNIPLSIQDNSVAANSHAENIASLFTLNEKQRLAFLTICNHVLNLQSPQLIMYIS
jgi:hypothetical protein